LEDIKDTKSWITPEEIKDVQDSIDEFRVWFKDIVYK
jgi:hypothetical protein